MPDYRKLFDQPDLRLARTKMFQHKGQRSPETDAIAEDVARHAMTDQWPDVQDVTLEWVHHNQPDLWLLFATGSEPIHRKGN